MQRFILVFSVLLVTGLTACSSPYKMGAEVDRLKQGLSPQQAAVLIEPLISNSGQGHGIAASNTLYVVQPQTVSITADSLTVKIQPRTVEVATVGGSVLTRQGQPGDEQLKAFPFESLKRISVAPNEKDKLMGVLMCAAYDTEHCVQFWYGMNDLWIAVQAEDLNTLLAAATTLAPEASVVE